jgi:hypothetical protein
MSALFEEEGGDLFDVRQAILGHLQQGGDPSAFDRIHGTRLADKCIEPDRCRLGQAPKKAPLSALLTGQAYVPQPGRLPTHDR